MSNNSLEVKKENIFTKIVNFFKNLFGNNKQEDLASENIIKEEVTESKNMRNESQFLDSIRVNKEETEDPELLSIQERLEKNEISVFSISDEALKGINEICKRQVSNLAKELENKKTELNYLKFNLNSSK